MSKKLLTVGMCTYNDFDGLYFTIQSLRMYHPIFRTDQAEIIVIDNNPTSKQGEAAKRFCKKTGRVRYIEYTEKQGTSVRNEIFLEASGKYTVCVDCHVMLFPDAIDKLLQYYEDNPDCLNIVQGPLIEDDLAGFGYSHYKPEWGPSMYGKWGCNMSALFKKEPFEIPMQGLGVFSCETKNWVGFSEYFRGFGGEEGYIHEKFRMNGGKAICLPDFKWVHRFERPLGVPYNNTYEDRIWNYFVGWLEITRDPNHAMIKDIFSIFRDKYKKIDQLFEDAKIAVGI